MRNAARPARFTDSGRYRYVIDACCFLFMFVNMGITSTTFNVFQPYINALPAVGDTLGSFVVGVRMLSAFLVTFVAAAFYRKLDCRLGVTLACLLCAVGTLIFSFSTTFPLFCLGSVCTGASYGLGGTLAMTLVIGRWFTHGKSTALGVASMGTGATALILPSVVPHLVEGTSLQAGFLFESGLSALIAIVVFVLLRNRPAGDAPVGGASVEGAPAEGAPAGDAPAGDGDAPAVDVLVEVNGAPGSAPDGAGSGVAEAQAPVPAVSCEATHPTDTSPADASGTNLAGTPVPQLSHRDLRLMQIAILCMGMGGIGANAYLSTLLVTSGFDPYFAAVVLSFSGACLLVFKPITGRVLDIMGTRRGSTLFFASFVVGQVLLCAVPCGSVPIVIAGTFFSYTGATLSSIGVSTWALDFSTEQTRAQTIRSFQLFFTAGTFLCCLFPGALYDLCGTYVVSYAIFAAGIAFSAFVVIRTYRKYGLR